MSRAARPNDPPADRMSGGLAARLARGPVVLDGGLATELERRGHDLSDRLWSARLLRDSPADVEAVHRAFFEAGADVAITASYQATYEGFGAEAEMLMQRSVQLARRARDDVRPYGLVAASVGPYAVVLADRSEYTGDYRGASEQRIAAFQRPRIEALLSAEPDVLAFETVPSIVEVRALAELVPREVEAWMTFCCRDGERLSDGTPVEEAVRAAGDRFTAVGVNCTAPRHIDSLLERMRACTDVPLIVYPNGVEPIPPDAVERWHERGAAGIGGCCRVGPDTIASIAATLR
jgi:homocysteine S-methyltransferase